MGKAKINFADVEDSFETLPEGQYEVEVERVEVRESKSSEHNYLNWMLNIIEDGDYFERKLWMITSLSPRALFKLRDVFLGFGVIEDEEEEIDLDWDDDVDVTPEEGPLVTEPDLEGLTGIAVVENEMYKGREQNRVNDILNMEEVEAKPAKKSPAKKGAAKKGGGAARRRKLK